MSSNQREWQALRNLLIPVQYNHLVAGITGGVTSTLVLHPLDLLKIRLSVNDGRLKSRPYYHGIKNAIKTIYKEEGIRGMYRGVTASCISAGASWGFYFYFYNSIKNWMLDGNNQITLGPWNHMLAAAQAGSITMVLTNPIMMVKTRMCLQYADHYMNIPTYRRYTGIIEAFRKVYKYEGVGGLYKGLVPSLFNVSHGALQFMIYEEMKDWYYVRTGNKKLSHWEYLGFAAVSKLIAASATYPFQLVRARLQDQHQQYSKLKEVIKKTWKGEGIRGFYKGMTAYSLHVTPNICIVFLIYEELAPSD
ncbi:mitochondrial folate transporter/carrier [Galendromus occidentalis]|uniref:Solute carrier family 25 member 32 n=1 Tax=Galendromus occidentalis TaxID=34638 RepID=A0AAJ6VYK0_9ACAR|nr:mitochondrial folate transporter/carrier [Galendromus occidentalis]